MATNDLQQRWGRETRLLVLIVFVSLAVLLILARFRFPAANLDVAPPAPSPLANLAGRAAFQDLADTMVTLFGYVSPRVTVVRLETVPEPPTGARGGAAALPDEPARAVLAVALRVRPDLAIVHVPAGLRVVSFLGSAEPAEVVSTDPVRQVALVRIPFAADTRADAAATDLFAGFAYVGAVGATPNGPSVEPVFVGRTGPQQDGRWPAALIAYGPTGPATGALLFSVDGRLVGLAIRDAEGRPAIAPPSVIEVVVGQMTTPADPPAGAGS